MTISTLHSPTTPRAVAEAEIVLENKIYWGGIYSYQPESISFPHHNESQIRNKSKTSEYKCFPSFEEAIYEAKERIWIIDKHFNDEMGFFVLKDLLGIVPASDIRIISKSTDLDTLEILNQERKNNHLPSVYWIPGFGNNDFEYAHDRFAVIDLELWHFGATVGGAHTGLQAASRGWSANKTRAIAFFNEIWKYLGGSAIT